MAASGQSRRRVQSIEVGFRVLRVLRMADGLLPLREVAKRAEMPPSKVHLYLVSFIRENMAYQDAATGSYGLGSFAIQLGLAAVRQADVVGIGSRMLGPLRDETQCAVYLSLWGDRGPCIVAKADGNLQGAFALRLGYILPVATSATGNVFLAHLPREDVERVMEIQDDASASGVSRRLPKEELDKIAANVREQGFASTVESLNNNFAGLSAPIFGPGGDISAALTLLGSADYITGERKDAFRDLLLEAAETVTDRLAEAKAEPADA